MQLHLLARTGHPDFLDLPWDQPLELWDSPRLATVPRGISRHVVRFVRYEDGLFALKALPARTAHREYRMLRHLQGKELPAVEPVGTVTRRVGADDQPLPAVLITRYLDYSLPYRVLFSRSGSDLPAPMLDTLTVLLVRLHLAGVFWGDCSLSNTLFRRDAGALAAYLVDAETVEVHPELTDGQRALDLEVAVTNMGGELLDLTAGGLVSGLDPIAVAADLQSRYEGLWAELTREEVFDTGDRWRIDQRLRRINELGFDTEELELVSTAGGHRLRLVPRVVEQGHHRRRLRRMTGLEVQENQARRLLDDIAGYRGWLEQQEGRRLPDRVAAARWLHEVFEPSLSVVPPELGGRREPAELFHELLEHRWFLSEAAGRDIGTGEAVRSYVDTVLAHAPDERTLTDDDDDRVVNGRGGAPDRDGDAPA